MRALSPLPRNHITSALNAFLVMYQRNDIFSEADQLGKKLGLPVPLSRCAPVCSRSPPLLLLCAQSLPLCARAFPCVLKLPKRLMPVCAKSNTGNTKTLT